VTIAENNNLQSIGTNVTINPGIYREQIMISGKKGQTASPMTFQAATPGTVFVSGAVQYKNWNPYGANPSIYTSAWQYQWGLCDPDGGPAPPEYNIVMRREMIFVNGAPMTQVLSLAEMIFPGMFFVDEINGLLYLWPPSGVNMTTADVEVARLGNLLTVNKTAGTPNGVVFRGITFGYSSSCHKNSAVLVSNGQNVLFDTDAFVWNNAIGIGLSGPSANISIVNSIANHNGVIGIHAYQVKNDFLQNDEASYNNWRGALGSYYMWNSGGVHSFSNHNNTWNNLRIVYNQTYAIHWDTDNQNSTATGIFSAANLSGPLNEKNEGPTNITGSTFCSSGPFQLGEGFTLLNSPNTTLSGNLFYGSNDAQLMVTGVAGGVPVQNWETGKQYNLLSQNTVFQNNTIVSKPGATLFKDQLGGSDWSAYVSTLSSNFNTYWNSANPNQFVTPYPQNGTVLNLPGWQANTGQDTTSLFQAPAKNAAAACAVTADGPDFWLISNQSQLATDISGTAVFTMPAVALGGFTGTLTLATAGLPAVPGFQASFNAPTMSASGTATLTATVSATTPPGTYNFTALANSGNVTHAVVLSVTVPTYQVWVTPSSLVFNNQPVGTTSAVQTIKLTNLQSSAITIGSITPSTDFNETDNCGTSLGAGASCTIKVSFNPQGIYLHAGSLTIADSVGGGSQVVSLTGSVVGVSKATLTPLNTFFGNNVVGTPSSPSTAVLKNSGTATMNISSMTLSGANYVDYASSTTCSSTLAVNASCNINITFTPTALGARAATITINSDALGGPQVLSLHGTGTTAVSVSPVQFHFGSFKVGQQAPPQTITLTNLSTAPLQMFPFTFTGANASDFTQTNNCGNSVAGNASCTITVTFAPLATGSRTGTLNLLDSDPTSPQTVALYGGGQ
jgi:hypothetical protein